MQLFQDSFLVAEIDRTELAKNRHALSSHADNLLVLYSAQFGEQKRQYYEIVYTNKHGIFLVYHHENKDTTTKMFDRLRPVLGTLDRSLQGASGSIEELLRRLMASIRQNPELCATHFAAILGLDAHFLPVATNASSVGAQVEQEVNMQIEPTLWTPLHLAIKNANLGVVQLIVKHYKPNLDLVDAQRNTILHDAALYNEKVLKYVLTLPGMFDRILWKNQKGCTALHLACFAENIENICEFLQFGLTSEMLTLPPPKLTYTNEQPNDRPKPKPGSRPVRLDEKDLEMIDFSPGGIKDIGGLLHWVKNHVLMERLMSYDFDLNTKNIIGDTPLHIMVKKNRPQCMMILLCNNNIRVDSKNMFGNTPLYHAAQGNEKHLAQILIVFDADVNMQNNKKISIRHEAASKGVNDGILLYMLSSIGAKRCPADMTGCSDGCQHDGRYEGKFNTKLAELDSDRDAFFRSPKITKIIKERLEGKGLAPVKGHRVNLLTFDGGGIKGLLTLQVMIEIEKYLRYPIADYFRWIGGTSTGSIICSALAVGKRLKHIRNLYFTLKSKIFVDQRPYSSEILENFLKEEFGSELTIADLKTKHGKHVIIPAVLFDRNPMQLHLFRSYPSPKHILGKSSSSTINLGESKLDGNNSNSNSNTSPSNGYYKPLVNEYLWKACRASGAAPTYFKHYESFIDGGMMANNPTLDSITENENYNVALEMMKQEHECEHLNLVLSIGTGRFPRKKTDLNDLSSLYSLNPLELRQNVNILRSFSRQLIEEITNTNEHVVNRTEATCTRSNIPYFRINPLLAQEIELDEKFDGKIINVMWETKRYMHLMHEQVLLLADYLEKTTDLTFASRQSPSPGTGPSPALPFALGNLLPSSATSKSHKSSKPVIHHPSGGHKSNPRNAKKSLRIGDTQKSVVKRKSKSNSSKRGRDNVSDTSP